MDLKNRPLDEPTLGEGILESLANVAALASGGLLGLIGVQLGMAATSLEKKRLLSTINNLIEEKIIYNLINNESLQVIYIFLNGIKNFLMNHKK